MKNFVLISLSFLAVNFLFGQGDENDSIASGAPKRQLPSGYTFQSNVIYTTADNWNGTMDIYLPPPSGKPVAIIINIHGGGWVKSNKESQRGLFDNFFACGYAVANVEYRLADVKPAPAAIEDVRCAMAYLVQNASKLHIDTSKFVMMGVSAGAHLALMAGLLENDQVFSKRCQQANSIKVAAIIDKSGIADVAGVLKGDNRRKWAVTWIGDKTSNQDFVKSVSPIYYINKNSPPVFIVHSSADPVVPYQQSLELNQKLKDLKVKTELITVSEKAHGIFSGPETKIINDKMISFLKDIGI